MEFHGVLKCQQSEIANYQNEEKEKPGVQDACAPGFGSRKIKQVRQTGPLRRGPFDDDKVVLSGNEGKIKKQHLEAAKLYE